MAKHAAPDPRIDELGEQIDPADYIAKFGTQLHSMEAGARTCNHFALNSLENLCPVRFFDRKRCIAQIVNGELCSHHRTICFGGMEIA
jgi:hypothetical protein